MRSNPFWGVELTGLIKAFLVQVVAPISPLNALLMTSCDRQGSQFCLVACSIIRNILRFSEGIPVSDQFINAVWSAFSFAQH